MIIMIEKSKREGGLMGWSDTCVHKHRPKSKFAGGQKQLFAYINKAVKGLGAGSDLDNVECHVVGHPGRGRSPLCVQSRGWSWMIESVLGAFPFSSTQTIDRGQLNCYWIYLDSISNKYFRIVDNWKINSTVKNVSFRKK